MSHPNRQCVIAGNWKMYKTFDEAVAFLKELIPLVQETSRKVYLAVPFTLIRPMHELAKDSKVEIGAQNMHDSSEGAFTGEIAGKMLKEAGANFVILGHSERRHLFNESNAFINKKVKRAIIDGLQPLLCIGETEEEREAGKTEQVLQTQLKESLEGLDANQLKNLIIAYEPVWAIGSSNPATPEIAQEAHLICRNFLTQHLNEEFAQQLVILYGGSVRPQNAKSFLEQVDIDGLLVGGASLSVDSFSKIVND